MNKRHQNYSEEELRKRLFTLKKHNETKKLSIMAQAYKCPVESQSERLQTAKDSIEWACLDAELFALESMRNDYLPQYEEQLIHAANFKELSSFVDRSLVCLKENETREYIELLSQYVQPFEDEYDKGKVLKSLKGSQRQLKTLQNNSKRLKMILDGLKKAKSRFPKAFRPQKSKSMFLNLEEIKNLDQTFEGSHQHPPISEKTTTKELPNIKKDSKESPDAKNDQRGSSIENKKENFKAESEGKRKDERHLKDLKEKSKNSRLVFIGNGNFKIMNDNRRSISVGVQGRFTSKNSRDLQKGLIQSNQPSGVAVRKN